MTSAAGWRQIVAEINQASGCARPIRLWGVTLNRSTGELVEGRILVPCKDRRAAVCPQCSRLYQADAWHLVAAGIRGGKGVTPDVVGHPQLFVTLTAPSFGPVHSRDRTRGSTRPCRPRRNGANCPHGVVMACAVHHPEGDPLVGEPLCPDCFDYRGAVLWNAHVPRLWERTSFEIYRRAALAGHMNTSEFRTTARLSYMKVVEFQRRGLVHLHLVLRADGVDGPSTPPPIWLDEQALIRIASDSIAGAGVPVLEVPGTLLNRASWGTEHAIRILVPGAEGDSTAIAAYVAKYATKTADGTPWLAYPIRSVGQLERLALRPHIHQMVRTAWALGHLKDLSSLRLQAHAHTLGYTGQFSSKSFRFSTTFGALRGARVLHMSGDERGQPEFDGAWRYAGRGYDHPESDQLVSSLFEASTRIPRQFHTTSTTNSTVP